MLLAISNVTKHVIPGCYFECSMPYYFEASFLHEDPGHEQLTFNQGNMIFLFALLLSY